MGQNGGLGGVRGNSDGYVHLESHQNGVLCGNWRVLALLILKWTFLDAALHGTAQQASFRVAMLHRIHLIG